MKKVLGLIMIAALSMGVFALVGCSNSADSGNYMDTLKLESRDVMNGTGTNVIGQYGYVKADEAKLKQVSKEDFQAWVSANVEGQNDKYNWATIDFGNGTGIQWQACITVYGSPFGGIDDEGCLTQSASDNNFEDILS